MHISFVSDTYRPDINGVAVCLTELISRLEQQNHQVSLIRPAPRCDYQPTSLEYFCRGIRLPHYPEVQLGLPSHRLFYRIWKKDRPDIIYLGTEGPLGIAALITARRLKIPVISAFHTNFHQFFTHYGMRHLQRLVFTWLKLFHRFCDLNLIPSRVLSQDLKRQGFTRAHYLSHGVDNERFHPRHRSSDFRTYHEVNDHDILLLFVGRVAKEKNLEVALRTYRTQMSQHPNLKMMVTGSGPELMRLKSEYPDVIFTGALTDLALSTCYASADIFVMPSQSETFGLVVLEALASGLPVIAYDLAAAAEFITCGINGELCENLSDRAFGRALAYFLKANPDQDALSLRKHYARAASNQVGWDQVTEDFIAIAQGLIQAQSNKRRTPSSLNQQSA